MTNWKVDMMMTLAVRESIASEAATDSIAKMLHQQMAEIYAETAWSSEETAFESNRVTASRRNESAEARPGVPLVHPRPMAKKETPFLSRRRGIVQF